MFSWYWKAIITMIEYFFHENRPRDKYVIDRNNMLLFFSVCRNNNLLSTLKNMIPLECYNDLIQLLKGMEENSSYNKVSKVSN